jgi:CelD/BcsL family acetyltransferase involved in cellulose biosynthesis
LRLEEDPFVIEIIDSLPGLDRIESGYERLFERSRNPSFFCSFPFVRTAWAHFNQASDRLLVLAVRKRGQLVGIAPFMIEPDKLFGLYPFRVIRYVADWGDGDKPAIVTTEDERTVWKAVCAFLKCDFTAWDAISFDEQPLESPLAEAGCFPESAFRIRRTNRVWSFRTALSGAWSDYLRSLKGKVRGDWARCRRRLEEHAQPLAVEWFEAPDEVGRALDRYAALERRTWKGDAVFSVGGTAEQLGFYRDLVDRSATKGRVAICFLRSGRDDAAAALIFRSINVVYGAQICYAPELGKFSPGIVLNAEIMKRHFDSHFTAFDFLALQGGTTDGRFRSNWATESQQLATITIFKRGFRDRLYRMDKRIHRAKQGMFASRRNEGA